MPQTKPEDLERIPSTYSVRKVDPHEPPQRNVQAPFNTQMLYTNGLSQPVTITLRNGLSFTIPSNPSLERYSRYFTCQIRYQAERGVNIDVTRLLDEVDPETSPQEMVALKKARERAHLTPVSNAVNFGLDYSIPKDDIVRNGGAIYVHELDILVSMGIDAHLPVHPFSDFGIAVKSCYQESQQQSYSGFMSAIELIDNADKIGDVFINFYGKAYRIPARKDPERTDGFTVYQTHDVTNEDHNSDVVVSRFTYDELDKMIGLFATPKEAEAYGSVLEQKNREIERAKQAHEEEKLRLNKDLKEQAYELETVQNKAKQAQVERDTAYQERKQLLEELERRRKLEREEQLLDRKDHYERRAYQRKDSSEFLRWIPHVIVGIGGLFMAFQKLKG